MGLILFLASLAYPAGVLVSTTVPTHIPSIPMGMAIDQESGTFWSVYPQLQGSGKYQHQLARMENGNWTFDYLTTNVHPDTQDNLLADRLLAIDSQGSPHLITVDTYVSYWTLKGGRMDQEVVTLDAVKGITLVLDQQSTPHIAFVRLNVSSTTAFYAHRTEQGWVQEPIVTVPGIASVDGFPISLALDSGGVATVACHSNPVRVFRRVNNVWTLLSSFPSPCVYPTLRTDSLDRTHLVMHLKSTDSFRYVRWDPSLAIELDQTTSLPSFSMVGNTGHTDMEIDSSNEAHIIIGKTYMEPSGNPFGTRWSLVDEVKLALFHEHPFFLNFYSRDSLLFFTTLSLGAPPGPPELIARSTHSLTWSFVPSTGSVLGHRLIRTTNGSDVSGLLPPGTTTFTETELAPNTFSQLTVRAEFPVFQLNSSSAPPAHTLTVPPENISLSRPSNNTLAVHWTSGGNTEGTNVRVDVISSRGETTALTTSDPSIQFQLDPSLPNAITLTAINGDGLETKVSSVTAVGEDSQGAHFSFGLSDGLAVDLSIRGATSGPALAVTVVPVTSFPVAPLANGDYTPTGVGFEVPTSQYVPDGQTLQLTLHDPNETIHGAGPFALAHYDPNHSQWIPLVTQWEKTQKTLTASTRSLGLFQVMIRNSSPMDLSSARVFPNPFRPSLHNALAIQEAPPGARVRIYNGGGRLLREFSLEEGSSSWDGRDAHGQQVHSGVYVLRLEYGGNTRRFLFVVER